jgi:hypothetical protein
MRDTNLKLSKSWAPSAGEYRPLFDWSAYCVEWIDEEHVACLNEFGQVTVWHLPDTTAVWKVDHLPSTKMCVSPGGKYVVADTRVYESRTGKFLNTLPLVGGTAFDAAGKLLATIGRLDVGVVDITTREILEDISLPEGEIVHRVHWVDDDHVLVNGRRLIDVERRLVPWMYDTGDYLFNEITGQYAGAHWYVIYNYSLGAHDAALVPVRIPHEAAAGAIANVKEEDLLAVGPGSKVGVEIQVPPENLANVEKCVREALRRQGHEVGQGEQLIRLVIKATKVEPKTEHYDSKDRRILESVKDIPADAQALPFVYYTYAVEFQVNGQTVRKSEHRPEPYAAPSRLAGESLAEAVNRFTNEFFVQGLAEQIPRQMADPSKIGPYGKSKITLRGLQ